MDDRDERRIDLTASRADGWYERVVASFAPLERLANYLGDGLVALALAGGFRIAAVQSDKLSSAVTELSWTRQRAPIDSPEAAQLEPDGPVTRGTIATLRTAVLAALVGDAEPVAKLPDGEPDAASIRAYIGARSLLLAPLFGLSLAELRVSADGEARVIVAHDGIEEVVALKQLRRFLRQRVVEVLQGEAGRGQVAIELAQADLARVALDEGRPEEAVARLVSWLAPLSVFHRTAEGQALDRATRARLARALGMLAEAFSRLHRTDERNEVLRLSLQYALDGEAAPDLYLAMANAMIEEHRDAEAIGPLRRALALGAPESKVLAPLGAALARSGRAVAALGCARRLRAQGVADSSLESLVKSSLGTALDAFDDWIDHGRLAEPTTTTSSAMIDAVVADLQSNEPAQEVTTKIDLLGVARDETLVDHPVAQLPDEPGDER